MAASWSDWAVDRFGLKPIFDHVLNRRVPKTPWYYGDGATLALLFGVQVITGVVLALTYSPHPDAAYQSVQHITTRQTLGWFVRGLHYWAAGLMVVMLFFHFFRLLLVAGYKFPREGTWLLGTVLFFGLIFMSYTGYVLRWDERAVYGVRVLTHMMARVPLVGEWLVNVVQGGPELGAPTLTRYYSLHVILLPVLLSAVVGYHLYLVILRGVTSPAEQEQPIYTSEQQKEVYHAEAESPDRGEPFHPYTTMKSGVMAGVVFAVAVALTIAVGPRELQAEANLIRPAQPSEEWWLWWYSALIALLPTWVAPWFVVVFPPLAFLLIAALPFLDRGPNRGMRRRPIAVGLVVLMVIALLVLTDLRRRSDWTGWPDPKPPPVPAGARLDGPAEEGRVLFARYGCNSCHAVSGHGPKVGTDLANMTRRYSREEIRDYTLRPPPGVAMPPYEGRLSKDDLERVVEFVHVAQTFPRQQ